MKMTWMMKLLAATLFTLSAHAAEPTGAPKPKETRSPEARSPETSKPAGKPGITDIQYFAEERSLKVGLANGRSYVYSDVPPELAEQFAASERKQEFLDRRIRPEFDLAKPTAAAKPGASATQSATPKAVGKPEGKTPAAKAPIKAKADITAAKTPVAAPPNKVPSSSQTKMDAGPRETSGTGKTVPTNAPAEATGKAPGKTKSQGKGANSGMK